MGKVLTLTEYHLRSMKNWRSLHYGRLIEPFLYLGLLLAGVNGLVGDLTWHGQRMSYAAFAFPGILLHVALRSWAAMVSDVANDRKWGVYALARMHGLGLLGYATSLIVAATVSVGAQVLGLGLLMLLLGYDLGDHIPTAACGYVLVVVIWLLLGIAVGMTANS